MYSPDGEKAERKTNQGGHYVYPSLYERTDGIHRLAYEHDGQLAKAREAYEKALALEPENALVRQNYELFKEINDRAAQKDGR